MKSDKTFDHLIIGLFLMLQNGSQPGNLILRRSCNALCRRMGAHFPITYMGLMQLFEKSPKEWWPADLYLPPAYDTRFPLLNEGSLSEEANAYYYSLLEGEANATLATIADQIRLTLDNHLFRETFLRLREKWEGANAEERAVIESEYVHFRKFLIQHPFATTADIRNAFAKNRHIFVAEAGQLYGDCPAGQQQWVCSRCGPLTLTEGVLLGIRQSVCSSHHFEAPHVQQLQWEHGLRRILPGIHWRVCFPGIPEMQLLQQLTELQNANPTLITSLQVWPGLDQYDLRVQFWDGTAWAADVKDYINPFHLATVLGSISGGNQLQYQLGFFVVPDRWSVLEPNYIHIVREKAKLSSSNEIVYLSEFTERVQEKIRPKQRKRKK